MNRPLPPPLLETGSTARPSHPPRDEDGSAEPAPAAAPDARAVGGAEARVRGDAARRILLVRIARSGNADIDTLPEAPLGLEGDHDVRRLALRPDGGADRLASALAGTEQGGRPDLVVLEGSEHLLAPGFEADAAGGWWSALDGYARPVVVRTPRGDGGVAEALRDRLPSCDLIVASADEPPRVLGARIGTVMARQDRLDGLLREIHLLRRSRDGAWREVRRLHEELSLAARLQRDFIPDVWPCRDDLRVDVLFRPAGYVSGDVFDVFDVDEHHLAFVLADVVGHGVPAALLTITVLRSMRRAARRTADPVAVLAEANAELVEVPGFEGRFATTVFGVIDDRDGRIRLGVAGHPPPLLLRPDGTSRPLEGGGPPLGVVAGAEFRGPSARLDHGDRLVIHSDGFETAYPPPDEPDRDPRLPTATYLERFGSLHAGVVPADGLVSALAADLDRQPGSLHQIDDLTAMFVSRLPRA